MKTSAADLSGETMSSPRIRRARSLIFSLTSDANHLILTNFVTKTSTSFMLRESVIDITNILLVLAYTSDWSHPEHLFGEMAQPGSHTSIAKEVLARHLLQLLDAGCLVVEGTKTAAADEAFSHHWEWGLAAGLYVFGLKDPSYLSAEQTRAWLLERLGRGSPEPLYTRNDEQDEVSLGRPDLTTSPFRLMHSRRSRRSFAATEISLHALRDCLFAGLGITFFGRSDLPGMPAYPMKMSPSPGARNPHEGYVFVRAVSGLEPGIYHYSAVQSSLARLNNGKGLPERLGDLIGGQSWADSAAAVIVLVANFARMTWKYPHSSALRSIFIEAGHIGQNIALITESHQLALTGTCALNDSLIGDALNLDDYRQAATYALVLGARL